LSGKVKAVKNERLDLDHGFTCIQIWILEEEKCDKYKTRQLHETMVL
jgi:hypothetical protein